MTTVSFFLPGVPSGKGRPRFTREGHAYTPPRTVKAERTLAWEAKVAMGGRALLEGPLVLTVVATYLRPRSWPKRRALEVWKTSKPDLDNILKLSKDSLNGIVWVDDSQVVLVVARKVYGSEPGLSVTVNTTDEAMGAEHEALSVRGL